jgi:hypothetical protein
MFSRRQGCMLPLKELIFMNFEDQASLQIFAKIGFKGRHYSS